MKALVILLTPAMMLIGCGQMSNNQDTADNVLASMNANGSLSDEDVNNIDESLASQSLEVSETGSNSVMLKLGGAELLIDFIENLTGDPNEVAMVINGVDVITSVAQDPQSFQGLIASLVTSQLEQVDISGAPAAELIQAGLGLISGDISKDNFSNLFGTIVRGFFNNFLSGSPIGAIIGGLMGDSPLGGLIPDNSSNQNNGNNNNSNNNANNNNSGSGILDGLLNTIGGGTLGGGNPLFGGIFSLISNLFK